VFLPIGGQVPAQQDFAGTDRCVADLSLGVVAMAKLALLGALIGAALAGGSTIQCSASSTIVAQSASCMSNCTSNGWGAGQCRVYCADRPDG
jgi:hypothetical protein